jgi:hypothetical protein
MAASHTSEQSIFKIERCGKGQSYTRILNETLWNKQLLPQSASLSGARLRAIQRAQVGTSFVAATARVRLGRAVNAHSHEAISRGWLCAADPKARQGRPHYRQKLAYS